MQYPDNYKRGFGIIDLILSILITGTVFAFTIPLIKGTGKNNIKDASINYQNINQEIDSKINDIKIMKQESAQYNKYINSQEF